MKECVYMIAASGDTRLTQSDMSIENRRENFHSSAHVIWVRALVSFWVHQFFKDIQLSK